MTFSQAVTLLTIARRGRSAVGAYTRFELDALVALELVEVEADGVQRWARLTETGRLRVQVALALLECEPESWTRFLEALHECAAGVARLRVVGRSEGGA